MEISKALIVKQMIDPIDKDKLLMLPTTSTLVREIVYCVRQLVNVIWSSTQR